MPVRLRDSALKRNLSPRQNTYIPGRIPAFIGNQKSFCVCLHVVTPPFLPLLVSYSSPLRSSPPLLLPFFSSSLSPPLFLLATPSLAAPPSVCKCVHTPPSLSPRCSPVLPGCNFHPPSPPFCLSRLLNHLEYTPRRRPLSAFHVSLTISNIPPLRPPPAFHVSLPTSNTPHPSPSRRPLSLRLLGPQGPPGLPLCACC